MPFNHKTPLLRIIAAFTSVALAATLLGGCAAARLAYNNAPEVLHFYLDSQFGFTEEQSDLVKAQLREVHAWHRSKELPERAKLLQKAQAQATQNTTSAQVCTLFDDLRPRLDSALARAVPGMAEVAVKASPEQLLAWQKSFDKRNATFKADHVSGTADARLSKRLESAKSNYERFYGKLSEGQLAALRASLERSGWDGAIALREAQRRQQDGLQTVKLLVADKVGATEAEKRLAALMARSAQSPDSTYRANAQKWQQDNCERLATLHNSATPEQRAKAMATLQSYEADVRALIR